jgi:hypothetical protein
VQDDDELAPEGLFPIDEENARPPPAAGLEQFQTRPATLHDWTRVVVAVGLLLVLLAQIVGAFLLLWHRPESGDDIAEVLGLTFGSTAGLVGAATGFYFGRRSAG